MNNKFIFCEHVERDASIRASSIELDTGQTFVMCNVCRLIFSAGASILKSIKAVEISHEQSNS